MKTEWLPGLLNADRRNRSLEWPYRESNPEPPVFWRNATINCAARSCLLDTNKNFGVGLLLRLLKWTLLVTNTHCK